MKFARRTALSSAALLSVWLAASAGDEAKLEALKFLVGSWQAIEANPTSSAKGETTFSWALQKRVIVRTNYAEYPATATTSASRHDDLMVIHESGDSVRADYYDNEGHVIRYSVTSTGQNSILFVSDALAGQPRYRLKYSLTSGGLLTGEFALAPPNAQDDFKPYLTWQSRRTGQ